MNQAPFPYYQPSPYNAPPVKVPTIQTSGTIITRIFVFIFAFTMGYSFSQMFFSGGDTYLFTFYVLMCVGSAFSTYFLSHCVQTPNFLAGKQSRLKMLWMTVGSLLKFSAFSLHFSGNIYVFEEAMWALIVVEIIATIFVFFAFYADENDKTSFWLTLKPAVMKDQVQTAPVYPIYGYPGVHHQQSQMKGPYPQTQPQVNNTYPQAQAQHPQFNQAPPAVYTPTAYRQTSYPPPPPAYPPTATYPLHQSKNHQTIPPKA